MSLSNIYFNCNGFPKRVVDKILFNIKVLTNNMIKKEYIEELLLDNLIDVLITINDENGSIRGFACLSENDYLVQILF